MGFLSQSAAQKAFAAQLLAFSEFIEDEVDDVGQHIAAFAWQSLVNFTPRKSGRAQNSWNFSFDVIDESVPEAGDYPKPKPPKIREGKEYTNIYVTSSLPYMKRLDEGYSSKGEKMVEKTLNALYFAIPTITGGRQNV